MGLSIALSNALSGMRAGQSGLDVLSRNVANAGVAGYHRQSITTLDTLGVNSSYVRTSGVTRAFNESLQQHFTKGMSDSGFTSVRANFVDRLQMALGKPGTPGSLDTSFTQFQSAMSALATSPDSYAARADAVAKAQAMVSTLNNLSMQVQSLRREAEGKIATSIGDLNQMLSSLEQINNRLGDSSINGTSRSMLLDQRDRLVGEVARIIDVRADYRSDGTVALMTRSGVGVLDHAASVFEFQPAGTLAATSQFSVNASESGVGRLQVRTSAGLVLDLVQQNVFRSGELAALVELRDRTLVQAQAQLDEVAAALAQAMSTVKTEGTAVAGGFEADIAAIRDGNEFVLDISRNGVAQSIRVVRVDDPARRPMDVTDADGNRVLGLDFSGGAASVAAQLQAALGTGFVVSNPAGSTLQVLDDGAGNTTDVMGLTTRTTVSATQGAGLALSLFVDGDGADFTNSLGGNGQKLGFAARIKVNEAVVDDITLMVQYTAGGSLGDDDRADYLLEQLDTMRFATYDPNGKATPYRLSGTLTDLISQTINHQGNVAATALNDADTQQIMMETLTQRMDSEYGVDVDEEMARLMELQNAYAANARVLAAIQELLQQLLQL